MTTDRTTATKRVPTSPLRRTALVAGRALPAHLCLILTPRLVWPGARSELHRRPRPGHPVIFGGVLEITVALACIGTAVVLYPVIKGRTKRPHWASWVCGFGSQHDLPLRREPAIGGHLAAGRRRPWPDEDQQSDPLFWLFGNGFVSETPA